MRRVSKLEEPTIPNLFPSSPINKQTIDERRLTMSLVRAVYFWLSIGRSISSIVGRPSSIVIRHSTPIKEGS